MALLKDIKGNNLTDQFGRILSSDDRWKPEIQSWVKQVMQDGGRVEDAWGLNSRIADYPLDGDVLFAYVAGGYKEGQIYTYDPFGSLTFARNSNAWGFGQNGKLKQFAPDIPRHIYDPATGTFLGFQKELQRTNANPNSSRPDLWAETRNTNFNPVGEAYGFPNTTIVTESELDAAAISGASLGSSVVGSTLYFSRSWYFRYIDAKYMCVQARILTGAGSEYAIIDIEDGVFISASNSIFNNVEVTKFSDGIVKITNKTQPNPSNSRRSIGFSFGNPAGTNNVNDGSLGRSVHFLGCQIETHDSVGVASSYIPTFGGVITRLADQPQAIDVPMGTTEIYTKIDGVESVQTDGIGATWEFPENSYTEYVIMK